MISNILNHLRKSPRARKLYASFSPTSGQLGQWARIVMNERTQRLIAERRPETLSVLEVSGNEWQKKLPFRAYKSIYFPEIDICTRPLPQQFDLVIAEQVFEHLLWPYRACKNVWQMLNPGGYFLITTPFMIRVHDYPVDCSRWTELGLQHFLVECGFPVDEIHTDSWGNKACVKANFTRWAPYRPMFHSLTNDPHFPVVVWALARRGPA